MRRLLASVLLVLAVVAASPSATGADGDPDALERLPPEQRLEFIDGMARQGLRTERFVPVLYRLMMGEITPVDHRVRERARDELILIGPPALPFLLDQFRKPPQGAAANEESWLSHVLGRIRPAPVMEMLALLQGGDDPMRIRVLKVLENAGPAAREAVADLVRLIQDARTSDHLRALALSTLQRIGIDSQDAAGYVVQLLVLDPNDNIRLVAAQAIGSMGSSARSHLPSLRRALEDANPDVRVAVCHALQAMGRDARTTLSGLEALALKDANVAVRRTALQAIVLIDPVGGAETLAAALADRDNTARTSLLNNIRNQASQFSGRWNPVLMATILGLTRDSNESVREWAMRVVVNFSPSHEKISALIAGLGDNFEPVRRVAAEGLRSAELEADRVIPALLDAARDQSEGVRTQALGSLGHAGRKDPRAEAGLLDAIRNDRSDGARRAAVSALTPVMQATGAPDRLVGLVVDLLRHPGEGESLRLEAAQVLSNNAGAIAQAVPALFAVASDNATISADLLRTVLSALRSYGNQEKGIAALAGDLLTHPDPLIVVAALDVLSSTQDEDFKAHIPRVVAALQAREPEVRARAASALQVKRGALGSDHLRGLLVGTAGDKASRVRSAAIQGLVSLEPTVETIDLLVGQLDTSDANIESVVMNWFQQWIDGSAPVPAGLSEAMMPRLADGSEKVRRAAAVALAKAGTVTESSYRILYEAITARAKNFAQLALKTGTAVAASGNDAALALVVEGLRSDERSIRKQAIDLLKTRVPVFHRYFQVSIPPSLAYESLRPIDADEAKVVRGELRRRSVNSRALENQIKILLQDRDPQVRSAMLDIYITHNANPVSALIDLHRMVQDEHVTVRRSVLRLVEAAWLRDPRVEDIVLKATEDRDAVSRQLAVSILGRYGKASDRAVAALVTRLSDPSGQVVTAAAEALRRLSPPAERVANSLTAVWRRDPAAAGLIRVYMTLIETGAGVESVMPLIEQSVTDTNQDVRIAVIRGLRQFPEIPEPALPLLHAALGDPLVDVRVEAVAALGHFGRKAQAFAGGLRALLTDASPKVQTAAIEAVAAVMPETAAAFLMPYLQSAEPHLRLAALRGLQPHAAAIPNAEGGLAPLIAHPDREEWLPAMLLAVTARVDPAVLADHALRALRNGTRVTRADAMTVLGRLDSVPVAAVEELAKRVQRNHAGQRQQALRTLEQIAARSSESGDRLLIPSLEQALDAARRAAPTADAQQADDTATLGQLVEGLRRSDWRRAAADQIRTEVERHFWIIAAVVLYVAMLAVCALLALVYPPAYVWLGSAGRFLRDVRIRFGRDGREVRIPVRKLAGLGFFDWSDRAARAWTVRYYRSVQLHKPVRDWLWVLDRWPFRNRAETP